MLPKKKFRRRSSQRTTRGPRVLATCGFEFLAAAASEKRGKFLLVAKEGKYVVLSVRNLTRQRKEELNVWRR